MNYSFMKTRKKSLWMILKMKKKVEKKQIVYDGDQQTYDFQENKERNNVFNYLSN